MPRVGAEHRKRQRDEACFGFLVRLPERAPEVVRALRETVFPAYHAAVTEDPWLALRPISSWPWDRADTDAYPLSARARLASYRWAHRHNLTLRGEPPRWLLDAAQEALTWWHKLGSRAAEGPRPIWPFSDPPAPINMTHHGRGSPPPVVPPEEHLDTLDRDLVWFIRWQVQRRTWAAIRKEFTIDRDHEATIRKAVARMAQRLGFTLRIGQRGRPSLSE